MRNVAIAILLAACTPTDDPFPVQPSTGTPAHVNGVSPDAGIRPDAPPFPIDGGIDAAPFSDGGPFIDAGTPLTDSGIF